MAVTTATKDRLRVWARNVHQQSVESVLRRLDRDVPISDDHGQQSTSRPPLMESRRVEQTGDLSVAISYPGQRLPGGADLGELLDQGTDPHPIQARVGRFLVFVWPAGPPELAWNRGTSLYGFKSVMHPGSHKHDGWWSNNVNAEVWSALLNTHARATPF